MSVAFRRESDDEHLEPKFELPIPPGPNLVTARGLAQIEARADALAAEVAAEADEERRKRLQRDLRYWQTRRATAEIVAPPTDGGVGIGSRVTYRIGAQQQRTVTIVGGDEADPAAGLIAFQAPLARALIRAAGGDDVAFGGGMIEIEETDDGQG